MTNLRSEPSSRTAFTGEQPDPWDVLPPQDAMSRHRQKFQKNNYTSIMNAIYIACKAEYKDVLIL